MTVVIPLMNYMCQDIRNLAFLDDKDLYGQFPTIEDEVAFETFFDR